MRPLIIAVALTHRVIQEYAEATAVHDIDTEWSLLLLSLQILTVVIITAYCITNLEASLPLSLLPGIRVWCSWPFAVVALYVIT